MQTHLQIFMFVLELAILIFPRTRGKLKLFVNKQGKKCIISDLEKKIEFIKDQRRHLNIKEHFIVNNVKNYFIFHNTLVKGIESLRKLKFIKD